MLILPQIVKVKWRGNNKDHYENKGYEFTSFGLEIEVNIEHLTNGCTEEVNFICDNCITPHKKRYVDLSRYKNHFCSEKCQKEFRSKNKIKNKKDKRQEFKAIKNESTGSKWTEDEINILKQYYEDTNKYSLQKMIPHRSYISIVSKARKLGLKSREFWTEDETNRLRELFPYCETKDLEAVFNRTVETIQVYANKIGVYKDHTHKEIIDNNKKEKLIKDLQDFANELGRTPHQIEVTNNKLMDGFVSYVRHFGTYAKACELAGLQPNKDFAQIYYSKNGDICLSLQEKVITDLLIDNSIPFEKEVYYKDITDDIRCGMKRCDWLIHDVIVEYFGMMEKPWYREKQNKN